MDQNRQTTGGRIFLQYELACDGLEAGAEITLPWQVDGVRFELDLPGNRSHQTLPGGLNGLVLQLGAPIAAEGDPLQKAGHFLWQCMVHIWMGWDHLTFLCFGLVRVPTARVEAVIALSILVIAREAIQPMRPGGDGGRLALGYFSLSACSAFFHGLVFASALSQIGVADHERVLALASFNIGVEVGQVVYVGALGLCLMLGRWIGAENVLRTVAAVLAGLVAGY